MINTWLNREFPDSLKYLKNVVKIYNFWISVEKFESRTIDD